MAITWINGPTGRFNGAFITARSRRAPSGNVLLSLYFSKSAVGRLGLRRGERLLVGLDEATQRIAFKPTLFGGAALRGKDGMSHLECDVTLPLFNIPDPQAASEDSLSECCDAMSIPFVFDVAEFKGWKREPLRAVA